LERTSRDKEDRTGLTITPTASLETLVKMGLRLLIPTFIAFAVLCLALSVRTLALRAPPNSGLLATYTSEPGLKGVPFQRLETRLSHNWAAKVPPLPSLPPNKFSLRWTGCIYTSSPRKLQVDSDDIVWLKIDNKRLIKQKGAHSSRTLKTAKPISKGLHQITLHKEDKRGPSNLTLSWLNSDNTTSPILPKDLVPPGGNQRHECPL
jgi:hypothetical protein